MNPELPRVSSNVEVMPQIPGGVEYFPDGTARSPELTRQQYEQQAPPRAEQSTQAVQAVQAVPHVPASVPVPAPVSTDSQSHLMSGNPVAAADDDLIEKEWVDKLKKIITLTRGNPYEQAKAIATLQADYLKKRYNRELGESSEA